LLAPLLLQFLLPVVAPGGAATVAAGGIVRTLAVVQFLPLCAGLAVATYRPTWAKALLAPLKRLGTILNLALLGVILVAQFQLLAEIRVRGYVGMTALVVASAGAGWLLGGRDAADRKALAITTSVRNVGVGLVIAGGSFPGTPAVTFTTAYALVQTVIVLAAAVAVGRRVAARERAVAVDHAATTSLSASPSRPATVTTTI
jgi:BASS family bile acid:Na+ symporter